MSIEAAADLVRRADPERFLSVMAAPQNLRERLFALYAFNVEVSRAAWVSQEPMIGQMRLQWWADMLDEYLAGQPVRKHEVATPLANILTRPAAEYLVKLVEARRLDTETEPLTDWWQARRYVDATSGGLMAAAASLCGEDEKSLVTPFGYGGATGMASYLIGQPAMAARGRHRFAFDEDNTFFREAVSLERKNIRMFRASLSRVSRPAARAAWLADRRLAAIEHDPTCRFQGGPEFSDFVKKGSLLIRIATRRV